MNNFQKAALAAMAAVSLTNLFGLGAAGLSVFLGILGFFVNKAREKGAAVDSGLELRTIGLSLREGAVWFWMAMPLVMDALSIALAKQFLPAQIDHVLARTSPYVSFGNFALLVVQLAVLALGEEIAWRAFFQRQLGKVLPIAPVLIISSLFFAMGHITSGDFVIVAYDVFFVFVNSILYGVVFQKTNNAWVSAISHFAANLFSVVVLVLL